MLRRFHARQAGFSLVEMLIALVFTGLLMAGLATVYRSSIQSFRSESEKLSSLRRNRIAADILRDDLDAAGQSLANISFHTANVNQDYPLLAVFPDNDASKPVDEQRDMLQFFYEEALPFEGRLYNPSGGGAMLPNESVDQKMAAGTAIELTSEASRQILINFRTKEFRDQFRDAVNAHAGTSSPISAVYKDNYRLLALAEAADEGSTACKVTITGQEDTDAGGGNLSMIHGLPSYRAKEGTTDYTGANPGAPITLVRPRLLVRYLIEELKLDPSDATKVVPCLVRRVIPYDSATDDMTAWESTVIAEDVVGFKVRISVDSGATWLEGEDGDTNAAAADQISAWKALKGKIDTAIQAIEDTNRAKFLSNDSWFRYFPMLVRLDVTTRTAVARNLVQKGGAPAAEFTKSTRVFVAAPRYFGMPLTSTM